MEKLLVILLLPFVGMAQKDTIASGAYSWKAPVKQKNGMMSTVLAEGKAHDFDWMQISANSMYGTKPITQQVPADQEEMIIISSGIAKIRFKDSTFFLTSYSVAVLIPGEKYTLTNAMNEHYEFYTMKYRKKDHKRTAANHSFVIESKNAIFKPNNIGGGRRNFFEQPTVMQKRFEVHLSTLKAGMRSHDPHTHKAEEIVLMLSGDTEMQIGNEFKKVAPGGFYYLGSNVLHAIKNIGTTSATYFAIQFE